MSLLRSLLMVSLLWPVAGSAQNIDGLYQQGLSEITAGNPSAAAQIYRSILAADPGQAMAHFQLSKLGLLLDDLRAAQDGIRMAIDLDQRNQEFRDFANEIGIISNGIRDAKRLHDSRNFSGAIDKYDELIVAYPNFATLHYRKGLSLQGAGQIPMAVGAFRSAQALNPGNEKYSKAVRALAIREYQAGERSYKIKDWAPAEDKYNLAIEIDPAFDQAYYRLARTLGRQGRSGEAIAVLDRAIAQNPAYLPVHLEKGNLLRGEGRSSEAADAYRQALLVDPDSYRAMVGLGQALKTDQPAQAIAQLQAALALEPENITANELLGELFSQREEWASAQPYLATAVALKPDDPLKLWRLAHVENNMGSWDAAKDLARRSVGLDDKFQPSWYELGRARKELGEIAGAIQAFKKAETGRDRATAADAARVRKQLEARR